MRLIKRVIDRVSCGFVTLLVQEPEDLWHAYHIIQEGDKVTTQTIRKVQSTSSTGSSVCDRVKITLTVIVKKVDFTPESDVLRITGTNVTETDKVKMGAFHALDIEVTKQFTVEKEFWDSMVLERVHDACDPSKQAEVAAVIMGEGIAHVCLITDYMTLTRAYIDVPIPRKRKASVTGHEKALVRFFESVMLALERNVDFTVVKCVIIASPGFVKDEFFEYLISESQKRDLTKITDNKSKFILAHSTSPHKCSLKEVLEDPAVVIKVADTKAAGEVRTLNEFYSVLKQDPNRAIYGLQYVQFAHSRRAIKTLLVTDELFRAASLEKRRVYVQLVESVRESGGDVKIFSSLHVSGEQLGKLTGCAAILRYPIPDIDEAVEEAGGEEHTETTAAADPDEAHT